MKINYRSGARTEQKATVEILQAMSSSRSGLYVKHFVAMLWFAALQFLLSVSTSPFQTILVLCKPSNSHPPYLAHPAFL